MNIIIQFLNFNFRYNLTLIKLLIGLVTTTLFLACANNKPETNKDTDSELQRIQLEIHNANYSDAEKDIKIIISKEPENIQAHLMLASLYVHKSGLRIDDYFKLEEAFSEESDTKINHEITLPGALSIFEQVIQLSKQSKEIQRRLSKITLINKDQSEQILKAIDVLNSIQSPKATPGTYLYRAVIKTHYFKYLWSQNYFIPEKINEICTKTVSQLSRGIDEINTQLSDILIDFSKGLPKSKQSILTTKDSLNKNSFDIQMVLRSASKETLSFSDFIKATFQIEVEECLN